MNRSSILIFFLLSLVNANIRGQGKDYFILKGTFVDGIEDSISLRYLDNSEKWITSYSELKSGHFSFEGNISGPTMAILHKGNSETRVFLEPDLMEIQYDKLLFQVAVKGSVAQSEFQHLDRVLKQIDTRWQVVIDTLSAINERDNFQFQELKSWVLKPYFDEVKEAHLAFYKRYPHSIVTAFYLQETGRDMTDDSLKMYYERFPEDVKESIYGRELKKMISKRKIATVDTKAPSFTTTDIDSSRLSLDDFKGKIVLLDFWGSWCYPCRKGHPKLKKLYEKYRNKGVEFIGIAADDNNIEAWKSAVREDGLPWKQVLQGTGADENLAIKYNVESYPTKILIGRDGVIIARFGEDDQHLERLLTEAQD